MFGYDAYSAPVFQTVPSLKSLALVLLGLTFFPHHSAAAVKAAPELPVIDEHPIGRFVSEGGHVALSVIAHASAAMTYQWWKGQELVTNSVRITATNFVLNIDPVQTNDAGNYYAIAQSGGASSTSAVAIVTVTQVGIHTTVVPGSGLTFRIVGPVGDVYRMEGSANPNGPWSTNSYLTNRSGSVQTFRTFAQLPNFTRARLDHMLPVLYPAGIGSVRAYGKLNQVWRLDASTDLQFWFSFGTLTNVTGWVTFHDPRDFVPFQNFFRITPP